MGWKRDDVWLDSDLLWFREAPFAPEWAPPPIPPPSPPPGLVASRQRRAEAKRRRNRRRTRAAVLAVSPAVILPLGAARSAAGPGPKFLLEDPPSLVFHRGAVMGGDRPVPGRAVREAPVPKVEPKRARRRAGRAEGSREVDWHHATSVGLPFSGSLIDGTQLPQSGPNWVTWDPVTNSVPDEPRRLYGNERTIRAIISVAYAYRVANPRAPRIVVGDISCEGGGPMTDEHVSHQNGLDVDIYYPRRDGTLREPVSPDQIDRPLAQDLLDRFVAAGAQMVFVGFSTGLHGPAGVVIPYPNHDNHMHVRFPPPGG